jgi:hypothetical protein
MLLRRLTTLIKNPNSNSWGNITIKRTTSTPAPSIFKRGYRYAAHMAQTGVSTIINARWVIPIVPENKILEHHSVAVDGAGKLRSTN